MFRQKSLGSLSALVLLWGLESSSIAFEEGFHANSHAPLLKKILPGVVNIYTTQKSLVSIFPEEFFGGMAPFYQEVERSSLGSGFFITSGGEILTNAHVVENAVSIRVKTRDGKIYRARIIGSDKEYDVALLSVKRKAEDSFLVLGDSDAMDVGDHVLAIGNPMGFEHTVSEGIISAKGRVIGAGPYDNFLQTDAAINPGNSGGPLIDMEGRVIGINAAVSESAQGIGFAIPINMATSILEQLRRLGRVIRGWLGVKLEAVTPEIAEYLGLSEARGAVISWVYPRTPASRVLSRGDVLLEVDGRPVHGPDEVIRYVAGAGIGKNVTVKLFRNGTTLTEKVKVIPHAG